MKYIRLVWRYLFSRKLRTTFTLLSILIAFVLYGFLMTIRAAFSMGIEVAGADRLIMTHKVSLLQLLPISYLDQIQSTRGVTIAAHNTWFGGTYQDKANTFALVAVDPLVFLKVYPEFKITPEELKVWQADRQGVVVGRDTAKLYNFKVGDRVPIKATIWQPKQGNTWEFNISAVYDGAKEVDKTGFYFHYDYLDENRRGAQGMVGWYTIRIENPDDSAAIGRTLDAQFANSPAETKTAPEKEFLKGFVNQMGDIGAIMTAIAAAVFFCLFLLVAANTMAQAVRERTSQFAVLKTLGFPSERLLVLVLTETLFMSLLGGLVGLGLTMLAVNSGGLNNAFLPVFALPNRDVVLGVILCVVLGAMAGAIPGLTAMRLRIVDALRRN